MRILRSLLLGLVGILFYSALSSYLLIAPLNMKLSTPETPKRWLRESGAYEVLVPVITEQAVAEQHEQGTQQLALKPLTSALDEALPAETLTAEMEEIIDEMYAWLEGKIAMPRFSASLSDYAPEITTTVSAQIKQHLKNAPRCQDKALKNGYDPFADNCIPPGQSPSSVARQYSRQLFANDSPLNDIRLEGREVFAEGQSPTQHPAPRIYQGFQQVPRTLLIVMAASAALILALARPTSRAIRILARSALAASSLVIIGAICARWLLLAFLGESDVLGGEHTVNVSRLITPLATHAFQDLAKAIYLYAIPVFICSLFILLGLWYWSYRSRPKIHNDDMV